MAWPDTASTPVIPDLRPGHIKKGGNKVVLKPVSHSPGTNTLRTRTGYLRFTDSSPGPVSLYACCQTASGSHPRHFHHIRHARSVYPVLQVMAEHPWRHFAASLFLTHTLEARHPGRYLVTPNGRSTTAVRSNSNPRHSASRSSLRTKAAS
jgi:hypothetical protein